MADRLGQRLGNYHLTSLLGRGAFADSYQGEHVYLNNCVAIKISHTYVDAHAIEDCLTDAPHLSHLIHPDIIRVFDFAIENQTLYLAMDYALAGGIAAIGSLEDAGKMLAGTTFAANVDGIDWYEQVAL